MSKEKLLNIAKQFENEGKELISSIQDAADFENNNKLLKFVNHHNDFLQDVASRLSTIATEVIHRDEIQKREKENSILLSLSNEIASVRNKNDLLQVAAAKLKELFPITGFGITLINEDGKTHSPFVVEPAGQIKNNPAFTEVVAQKYSVTDGVFDKIINGEKPVVFQVDELVRMPSAPAYVIFWKKMSVKQVLGVPLRAGENNFGCLIFHLGIYSADSISYDVLKGVCAQISVAIANVTANEAIAARERERGILLSLSADIAQVRDKKDLLHLIHTKLKEFLNFNNLSIELFNKTKTTYRVLIADVQSEIAALPEFNKIMRDEYAVNDGIHDAILKANTPLIRDVEMLMTETLYNNHPAVQFIYKIGIKEVISILLRHKNKITGSLTILSTKKNSLHESGMRLLQGAANQISTAVANIEANDKIKQSKNEKEVLAAVSKEMASIRDKKDLLQVIHVYLKKILPFHDAVVGIVDMDKKVQKLVLIDGEEKRRVHADYAKTITATYPFPDGVVEVVLKSDEAVIFDMDEVMARTYIPDYMKFAYATNVKEFTAIALRDQSQDIGIFYMSSEKKKTFNNKHLKLLQDISSRLSIAVANLLATEEIQRREEEKTILLSLSNEISSLKNRNDLFHVVNERIKKLFSITELAIAKIDEDGKTYSAFMLDLEDRTASDIDFKKVTSDYYNVTDAVFSRVIHSESPVIFQVNEIADIAEMPAYVHFWKKIGLQQVLCAALRAGGKTIGMAVLHIDINKSINPKSILLSGVCAQISVAVSNILANEAIVTREVERELLLSLNTDIMAVRDYDELLVIIAKRLKKYFAFAHTHLAKINDDKTTISPFLFDPKSKNRYHPAYGELNSNAKFPINDGILNIALTTASPVVFDLEQWKEESDIPLYVNISLESGIKQVMVIRFSKADEVLGFLMFFFDEKIKKIIVDANKSSLLQGIANQISIAVSNIRANREIEGREAEKSRLLAFSNAIASVRDKVLLAKILNQQLKELFGIKDCAIHALSEDKKTHRPIIYDPDAEFAKHPVFQTLVNQQTDVNDGIFNTILNSDDPVTFDAEQWVVLPNPPVYANAAIDIGLKKLTGIRVRLGEENIAVWNFRHDNIDLTPDKYPLLKSVCSQIAIAVSNIIANEKVNNQLSEINKYKQQLEEEKIYLKEEIETTQNYAEIIGDSVEIKKIFRLVTQVAKSDSTVLIQGETGTGKELIARAIHNSSPRKNKLMVKVNCAALPANLIESELFGHERGSFTGATERRIGKFELANHGTLFLDEIGEMPLELQVKLLRALQEKEIERVGGSATIKTDVRIIAATNRDLAKLLEEGRFRSDLYYRLNIFPITLPPLRNRREDIAMLASHFLVRFAKKSGKKINTFSNKALQELAEYNWPGNIRELEHLIERSVLLASGDTITHIDLPSASQNKSIIRGSEKVVLKTIDENEKSHILSVLKHCKGKVAGRGGAAEVLGVPPGTLTSKMKRLGIRREHILEKN